jgi:Predicted transcriptional regulator
MTVPEFARSLGFDRADKIYNLVKNKFNPSYDILSAITNKFVEIDVNWLITGKGSMLKGFQGSVMLNTQISDTEKELIDSVSEPEISIYKLKTDYYGVDKQSIPLFDIQASAGLNTLFSSQNTQVPLDYITVPNAPNCDGALFVRGDSMYPLLKAGDIICYKIIINLENIVYGEMYLLDIDNGDDQYLTVKYVQKSDKGNRYVKLVSENRYHADKDEPIKNIRALAIIKLSIRYNTIS